MNRREFLREMETREKEQARIEEIRRLNIVKNHIIRGSKRYMYETSKEFFLVEPHDNDLYVQN